MRARLDLDTQRGDALASEDVARLEAHETSTAAVERRVAVAETRRARLAGEIEAAEAEAEQAHRLTLYREGQAALIQARAIMTRDYMEAARAVADAIRRADRLRLKIEAANAALPADAEKLSIILEEDNSAPSLTFSNRLSKAHGAVRDFVNLPGVESGEYVYSAPCWGWPR